MKPDPRIKVLARSQQRGNPLTRRAFVSGGAAAVAFAVAGTELALHGGGAGATKSNSRYGATGSSGVDYKDASLVLCTLYGGNDGLNTVIPHSDPAYASGRGGIAIPAEQIIDLDGTLGLHPNLTGFKKLWDAGKLAIVRGIGYPNPDLSHFRSMDIWQSGVPDNDVSTGWVGRWMDATNADPLNAISVGDLLPKVLTGERALGAAVPVDQMTLPGDGPVTQAFSTLCTPTPGDPPVLAAIAQSGADMLRVQAAVSAALSHHAASAHPAGGDLGGQLDIVNKLITAGVATKVYAVSQQGYDTHSGEVGTQARLLGELDAAVTNFVDQMSNDPRGQHSVVVIYSEFGRRVQSNASGGTDHGAASVAFVTGPRVKGGYYGDYSSLDKLDANGNLVFTTDFRSVYATVLAHVIGEDPKVALGGSFPLLQFA